MVTTFSFAKFDNALVRCREAHDDASIHPACRSAFVDLLEGPLGTYRPLHAAVGTALDLDRAARRAAKKALVELDRPYRVARAALRGRTDDQTLPPTLKQLPMDTEKKRAIDALRALLSARAGEAWANELMGGSFGTLAPDTIAKLDAAVAAASNLEAARRARTDALQATWAAYLAFVDMVRQSHGTSSVMYRRIHLRRPEAAVHETPPTAAPAPSAAAPAPAPVPAH